MTDVQAVIDAEHAIAAAHVTLDLDLIERLYHPDFVIVQPDGTIETRSDVLASYGSGERVWTSAAVDRLTVRVTGGTAVAVGRWTAQGTNRGASFDYAARFLSVWIRDHGAWRNIAYQSIEIPH